MAMMRTFASLAVLLVMAQLAMGANHTVGGPQGSWDLSTNFQQWASSNSFSVGDNLIFQYAPVHSVLEVTKADYDSCQFGNPLESHTDGNTVIPLTSPGKRYFICGTEGHCSQGMKVEIDTVAESAPSVSLGSTPPNTDGPSPSPSASPIIPPPSTSPIISPSKSPSPSPKVPHSKSPSPSPKHSPSLYPKHSHSKSPSPFPFPSPSNSPLVAPLKSPSTLHSPSSSPSSSLPPAGSVPVPSPSAANGGGVGVKAATGFIFGMVVMMLLAL
ncbi:uclacyanin 1 [Magnolia sinica]|uniref:uclacyanin 1 n=1 Tax=Magnolia sinica TaxID=86752 RepID=UPI00265880D0|nr:uclacyanin 1 [Magnolia sinica]